MLNDDCLSILSVVQVCLYLSGKLDFGSDDFESDLYLLFPVEVVVLLVNKVPFHSASILHRLFLVWAFLDFRLFFPQELDSYLDRMGFNIIHKFGDFEGRAFDDDSEKQVFVCQ